MLGAIKIGFDDREEEVMSNSMTMTSAKEAQSEPGKPPFENMVWITGGTFLMGSDKHYPEEAPAHEVTVEGFWMDRHTVTNEEFRKFVEATKHVTSAERAPKAEDYPGAKPELLVPASVVFNKPRQRVDLRDCYNWWIYVPGANWRHPEGPASSLKGKAKHPVVHVAYEDVEAYAKWIGKELPTEAEWEFAARGGLDGAEFVWGDALHAGRQTDGEYLARRVSLAKSQRRRIRRDCAGGKFSRQRLRALRDGRQCVGVDHRLVSGAQRNSAIVLRQLQSREVENGTRAMIPTCPTSKSRAK